MLHKCRIDIDRYIYNNKQLGVGGACVVLQAVYANPGVGVVNGQPLPSTQYTRVAPALPGGGGVDVGNVGMKDSAVVVYQTQWVRVRSSHEDVKKMVENLKIQIP